MNKDKKISVFRNILQIMLVLMLSPISVSAVILSTSYSFNENVVIYDVLLDTEGSCINAGSINISFNNEHYNVVAVVTEDSLFDLWIAEPLISQENGYINFEGGVLWGYCGDSGETSLAQFILEKKEAEVVSLPNVVVNNTSRVLLHDGMGTEVQVNILVEDGDF